MFHVKHWVPASAKVGHWKGRGIMERKRKTDYSTAPENGMSFICNRWTFTGPEGYRVKANDDGTFRVVHYNAAGDYRVAGSGALSLTEDDAHEMAARLAKLPVHPKPKGV